MKKIILLLSVLALGSWMQQVNAQPCHIANPGVKLNYAIPVGDSCKINLDLYFDMDHNGGGKFAWVHIWPAASYSNWNYGVAPTIANGGLAGSIATFGIEHQQSNLVVQTSYPPDPNAPGFQFAGIVASEGPSLLDGYERYVFKNITLTVYGGCNVAQSFTADVWESQSKNSNIVHCFSKGLNFIGNDPTVTGLLICTIPHRYNFNIQTITMTGSMTVNYKVFLDDGNGIFNLVNDSIKVHEGSAVLNAGNNYKFTSALLDYLPYSNTKPYADRDLWIEVTSPSIPNAAYGHIINTCIPLPVKLTAFTAQRSNDRVQLRWTTASEINNRGFYILRQNGNTGWQVMGFVPSAAVNGNSDAAIQYSFTDPNTTFGVTQYRLQQVDLDNTITYSDIRMVKGMNQAGKLMVFPNPSSDGNLNVVLENMDGNNNIRLIDMNGRLVKEWINVTNGRITISQVASGMYTLRVWQRSTNEVMQVKVIVSK